MKEALVSIIVPVYNVEKYLSECIKGIIKQTYKNIEVVLIDDGSTDSCGKLCDLICEKNFRFRVIHQKNKGLSSARNAGIEVAKGEYVCFVDSDDMISPYMIEHLMALVRDQDADFAYCSCSRCNSDAVFEDICSDKIDIIGLKKYSSEEAMHALIKFRTLPVTAWGKIYKKIIFNELRFPEGKYNEDAFVSYHIIEQAKKICGCSNKDYYYRLNENSIMRSSFNERRFDGIEAKLNQLSFIQRKYPNLTRYAKSSIVAVCNECVFDMGVTEYSNTEKENLLRELYRLYLSSYLKDRTSFRGKMFAMVSGININLGKKIAKKLSKYKPIR